MAQKSDREKGEGRENTSSHSSFFSSSFLFVCLFVCLFFLTIATILT